MPSSARPARRTWHRLRTARSASGSASRTTVGSLRSPLYWTSTAEPEDTAGSARKVRVARCEYEAEQTEAARRPASGHVVARESRVIEALNQFTRVSGRCA